MDSIPLVVRRAYCIALLLGGVKAAENAVLSAIDAGDGVCQHDLLFGAIRWALRLRAASAEIPSPIGLLPSELFCLFALRTRLRDCFVLGILADLAPGDCAKLLDISLAEFQDSLCAALQQLPLLR